MRILIVRLSALGDLIHALPLASNAGTAGARVGWVVESGYAPLLDGNPWLDHVFPADTRRWRRNPLRPAHWRELRALGRELRDFAPDATIDAQGLWKSALLARLSGAEVVSFGARDRRERSSAALVDRSIQVPREVEHVVDQNLLLLRALGVPVLDPAPDARYLLTRRSDAAEAFLATLRRPFALFHPGSARPEKSWGEARYAVLARRIEREAGVLPVICWGPGDEPRLRRLKALLPEAPAIPPLDLPSLAHVIAAASLFVAGDTGPLHLADALRVPALGLFSPSARARNSPQRNRPFGGSVLSYDDATADGAVAARAVEVLRGGAPGAKA